MIEINKNNIANRFMRYVEIDTQSDPQSGRHPSTEKQKDLSKILVEELKQMGITDAEMDEYGYVYATIPSNTENLTSLERGVSPPIESDCRLLRVASCRQRVSTSGPS